MKTESQTVLIFRKTRVLYKTVVLRRSKFYENCTIKIRSLNNCLAKQWKIRLKSEMCIAPRVL